MYNQYSLKISALKNVGNVSVNSKPDHLPLADPWEILLMGEFPAPCARKSSKPHPWAYKNKLKPTLRGIFFNYSQYNIKK